MRKPEHDVEFRRFAVKFAPTLVRAAYVLLSDIDLAEDVVQGTMLRVFVHWDRARQHPEAYARETLVNICRDQWRQSKRRPTPIEFAPEHSPVVDSFVDAVERRETLQKALTELPDVQREVLTLRYFFDLPLDQTAEILDIPEGTVKSATSRGLERLRRLLTPAEEKC